MTSKEIKPNARSEGRGRTHAMKIPFDYKWEVADFTWLSQPNLNSLNYKIISPEFQIPGFAVTGCIQLTKLIIPKSYGDRGSVEMSFHLKCASAPPAFQIKVSVCNGSLEPYLMTAKNIVDPVKDNVVPIFFDVAGNKFKSFIIDNTLTFLCTITMIKPVHTVYPELQVSPSADSLSDRFKSLLTAGKYTDVTINVGSKKFNVHKLVLAARSSVFAAMFAHNFSEDVTSQISVTDISEATMGQLIQYLYTDQIERPDLALELLNAAEKYDLQSLKALCAPHVFKNIDFKNAAERLVIADRYNLKELKTNILQFIVGNRKEVMLTEGYKTLEKAHPNLLQEMKEFCWEFVG